MKDKDTSSTSPWTKDSPTEPGLYVLRMDKDEQPVWVRVFYFNNQLRFCPIEFGIFPGISVNVVSSTAEWAGPVILD